MARNIVVPSLGESIVEATVVHWYKKEGEQVATGEKLVELETDKVNLDVGAEQAGVLQNISHQEGDDVKVGEVLGVIADQAGAPTETPAAQSPEPAARVSPAPEQQSTADQNGESPQPASEQRGDDEEKERVTPVARRMAQDL